MKKIIFLLFVITFSLKLQAQDSTPLSEAAFDKFRKEVADQSYDSKRLAKAKELSDAHFLYVSQIKAVMEGMSLEGNKLEYAKYAYATTLDAENYGTLDAMFRMDDSKKDLKDYISKRKPPVIIKKEEPVVKVEENKNNTVVNNSSSTTTSSTTTVTKSSGPAPMTDQEFAAAKREVEGESFESSKLRRAKQISDANYLLCSQIKEIIEVLSFETSKLEYAQYSHAKTYDPSNYEVVKEALLHSKSKEDFTAFVKKQKVVDYSLKAKEETVVANNTVAVDNSNTVSTTLSNEDFIATKNQISAQSSDSKKLEIAKRITERTHLTTAQVKGIVELLLFEANRVEYAKHAYSQTTDKENFASVKELLAKENQPVLDDYIKTVGTSSTITSSSTTKTTTTTTTIDEPKVLSAEEAFAALLKEINSSALESHKLDKAKVMVDKSHFTANQVKQINDLFAMEEHKLDFAKYAYSRTSDKDKYSVVRDSLTKSTSKYSLDKHIKEQK